MTLYKSATAGDIEDVSNRVQELTAKMKDMMTEGAVLTVLRGTELTTAVGKTLSQQRPRAAAQRMKDALKSAYNKAVVLINNIPPCASNPEDAQAAKVPFSRILSAKDLVVKFRLSPSQSQTSHSPSSRWCKRCLR